jgi:hypothetical protein
MIDNVTAVKHENEPPKFSKKIGRTTYEVNIHFSTTSQEDLHKKIERLILNDVQSAEF